MRHGAKRVDMVSTVECPTGSGDRSMGRTDGKAVKVFRDQVLSPKPGGRGEGPDDSRATATIVAIILPW
jgi:hypothetical protein